MKKLISRKRWKDHLLRRQRNELSRTSRAKTAYSAPKRKRKYCELLLPEHFSLIHNPEAVNEVLEKIYATGRNQHISLDLTRVTEITPEAIAALVATISSPLMSETNFRGNLPSEPAARAVLLESGFFEHATAMVPLPKGLQGKIKKRKSNRVEPQTALELIECGTSHAFGQKRSTHSTRAAYGTLIELMANTHNHAAGKRSIIETWWATAYGDSIRKRVCYTFLDTGVGIFRSVRVNWIRRAFRKIGVQTDADILIEILQGRVESRTGLPYRGKGLPSIYKKSQSGEIKSLFIISNDVFADVSNGDYQSLTNPFPGTLMYWESEE